MVVQWWVIGVFSDIELVLECFVCVMIKIYWDCDFLLDFRQFMFFKFCGEEQDFEEMMGNLIDNVCKWVSGWV